MDVVSRMTVALMTSTHSNSITFANNFCLKICFCAEQLEINVQDRCYKNMFFEDELTPKKLIKGRKLNGS